MAIDRQQLLDVGGDEQVSAQDFAVLLAAKSAAGTVPVLSDKKIKLQRRIRISVLRDVLQSEADNRKTDRSNRLFRRLLWFSEFSEWQYEHYLGVLDDNGALYERYRTELWLEILSSAKVSKLYPQLYTAAISAEPAAESDSMTFCRLTDSLFGDKKGELDGLTPAKFRAVLYNSATIDQIRQLGIKYGLNAPRRLRKSELVTAIADVYAAKGESIDTADIDKLSVDKLEQYIQDNELGIKPELRKENLIEYILKYADTVKDVYSEPVSQDAYDKTPAGMSKTEYAAITAEDEAKPEPEKKEPVKKATAKKAPAKKTTAKKAGAGKTAPSTKAKTTKKAAAPVVQDNAWEGPGQGMEEVMRELKELRKEIEGLKVVPDTARVTGVAESDDGGLSYIYGAEHKRSGLVLPDGQSEEQATPIDRASGPSGRQVLPDGQLEEQATPTAPAAAAPSGQVLPDGQSEEQAAPIDRASGPSGQQVLPDGQSEGQAAPTAPAVAEKKKSALKITLLTILWIIAAVAAVALIYSAVTFFADIAALDGVNNTINKLRIGNKGILDHLHVFWGWAKGLFVR